MPATGYGFCKCGCGERTPIAKRTRHTIGHVKGEPLRYILGHHLKVPLEERFWAKVEKTETCWLWTAAINDMGYGTIGGGGKRGPKLRAHRVAYELFVGSIPDGLELDHLCRVRHCVNPAHLEAVTHSENMLRGVDVGSYFRRRTHCSRGHEYTPENTRLYRGERVCRTCKRNWQRHYARVKAEAR